MIYLGDKEIGVVVDSVDLSQTTATADDVLEGKEFFNASGEKVTGTYTDLLQWKCDNIKSLNSEFKSGAITPKPEDIYYICEKLDASQVYDFESTFQGTAIEHMPRLDTHSASTVKSMLRSTRLTEFPRGLDFPNCTNFENFMSYCNYLHTVIMPEDAIRDTREVIVASMFAVCVNLQMASISIKSPISSANLMFNGCSSLTTVDVMGKLDVRDPGNMFYACTRLVNIFGSIDFRRATGNLNPISGCTVIENVTFKNIPQNITIASGTSWGHLLTPDSLLNTIQELWTNTSGTKTLIMGTANTAKLADVYVKLIPITDEMRAEDGYIDKKAPFETCESTDEGAMLITEYVTTIKNWRLA